MERAKKILLENVKARIAESEKSIAMLKSKVAEHLANHESAKKQLEERQTDLHDLKLAQLAIGELC